MLNTTLIKYERDLNTQLNPRAIESSRKELINIRQSLNESYLSLDALNQFNLEFNSYFSWLNHLDSVEQTRLVFIIKKFTWKNSYF